jgi:hypothetical protein
LGHRLGVFDGFFEGGFAVGLELAEHGDVLFHAALDAGRVEGDAFEALVVSEPGAAFGEGDDCFGVVVARLEDADVEGEDGVFDGDGALQLPAAVGDGLDDAGCELAGGVEVFVGDAAVFVLGDLVFRGQEVDLAGEAVAECVEGARAARLLLALYRFGMH